MRIGIDARFAVWNKRGHGRYLLNLVKSLAAIDQQNQYVLYLDRPDLNNVLPRSRNFCHRIINVRNYILWEQLFFPLLLAHDRPHIIHLTNHTAPWWCPVPCVLTIHDVIFLYKGTTPSPLLRQRLGKLYKMLTTPRSVRGARQIIAVSQFTKKEIIRVLRKNPDDIVVIPEAPDPQFNVINDRSRVLQIRQKFNISDEYILCLGSEDPNKNTITIIRAYERLRNVVGPRYILVIVGMKNSRRSILKKMVDELRLGEDVILEDVVSDADLVALYNAAELFVFPSLYEGFGFPPLEAMSCGTPVIASDAASIPEVVADAAILVQPLNVQGWTEAMYQVLSNQSLREELINKGFRRVREFSWENAAQRTLKVYEEACKVE